MKIKAQRVYACSSCDSMYIDSSESTSEYGVTCRSYHGNLDRCQGSVRYIGTITLTIDE